MIKIWRTLSSFAVIKYKLISFWPIKVLARILSKFYFPQKVLIVSTKLHPTTGLPFGLLWNCLPDIKWFCHFFVFLMLMKIVHFKYYYGKIWANLAIFFEILNLNIFLQLLIGFFSFLRIWPFWNCLRPNLAFFRAGNFVSQKWLPRCFV